MKKLSLKLTVGLLALIIGIGFVWTSGIIQLLTFEPERLLSSPTANEMLIAAPTAEESGRVIIRFKGFELYKLWAAKFEITNYT